MPASRYDFTIEQGSSYQISFVYKDSNKNPIDLTNWCSRLIWKSNTGSTTEFSSENINSSDYTFTLNDTVGEIKLLLPATKTDKFNFKTAEYDLDLKSPESFTGGGDKYISRILYGTISIINRASGTSTDDIC